MKKIKRTITMRKIEIYNSTSINFDQSVEVCPVCHFPIRHQPPTQDSADSSGASAESQNEAGLKRREGKTTS
jgi:hypothetical protein